jgi:cysteine desulfurase
MAQIYLDFNASTPLTAAVATTMHELIDSAYGNPSSLHWAGMPARDIVDTARRQVAQLLGCASDEVVFTSGGSESNNLALKGAYFGRRKPDAIHIVTSCVEHASILSPCRFLEGLGAQLTLLPVDRTGRVDPDDLRAALRPETLLISVMHANNEVGTVQPIAELGRIAREHGVLLHTDAAQSVGKIPTRVDELGVDLLTIAGHKLNAPKGVGALYVRRGVELEPLIHGAGHEHGLRAGTESALLTAALGQACASVATEAELKQVGQLRDRLWDGLRAIFGGQVVQNGHPAHRLPNTLNVGFKGRLGGDVLALLPEIAASTGSACHAGEIKISPVLDAMAVPTEVAAGAVRFSLGRTTTAAEIDAVIESLRGAQNRLGLGGAYSP